MSPGSNMDIWPTVAYGGGRVVLHVQGFPRKGSSWDKVKATKAVYTYGLEFLTVQNKEILFFCIRSYFFSSTKTNIVPTPNRAHTTIGKRNGITTKQLCSCY